MSVLSKIIRLRVVLCFAAVLAFGACGGGSSTDSGDTSKGDTVTSDSGEKDQGESDKGGGEDTKKEDDASKDDTSKDDTSQEDAADDTSKDSSVENQCKPGELRCVDKNQQDCEDGKWGTVTPCDNVVCNEGNGVQIGSCDPVAGCSLGLCEDCADNLKADPTNKTCLTSCKDGNTDDDTKCVDGFVCKDGGCVPAKKQDGDACTDATECESGYCVNTVDGNGDLDSNSKVCCSGECTTSCTYCNDSGQCVPLGDDKTDSRCDDSSVCGHTGKCSAGNCQKQPNTVECSAPTCVDDNGKKIQTPASMCDGLGNCPTVLPVECGVGATCSDNKCVFADCKTHGECDPKQFCGDKGGTTATGVCLLKLKNGTDCKDPSYVADYDDAACGNGRCIKSYGDNDPGLCAGLKSCNWKGELVPLKSIRCVKLSNNIVPVACNDKGVWEDGSNCKQTSCKDDSGVVYAGCTDDKGCNTNCTSCKGFKVDTALDPVDCKTTCESNADCTAKYWCNPDSKACEERSDYGEKCDADEQCRAGSTCFPGKDGAKICCTGKCNKSGCQYCDVDGLSCKNYEDNQPHSFSDTSFGTCEGGSPCPKACQGGQCAYLIDLKDVNGNCDDVCSTAEKNVIEIYGCNGKTESCTATDKEKCSNGDCVVRDNLSDICQECSNNTHCSATQYCAKNGKCTAQRADGQRCNSQLFDKDDEDKNKNQVCTNVCKYDGLQLKDAKGTVVNKKGSWFCSPKDGSCVDGGNQVVSRYVYCDGEPTSSGVLMWVCEKGVWKTLTTAIGGQHDKYCPSNTGTLNGLNKKPGVYNGCGKVKDRDDVTLGWFKVECVEGVFKDDFTGGGCIDDKVLDKCQFCAEPYFHRLSTRPCDTRCVTVEGDTTPKPVFNDDLCNPENKYYCCDPDDTECADQGKCVERLDPDTTCNRHNNCKVDLCIKGKRYFTSEGVPISYEIQVCGCTSSKGCPNEGQCCVPTAVKSPGFCIPKGATCIKGMEVAP